MAILSYPTLLVGSIALICLVVHHLVSKPRLPNVPFLRISTKQGVPGDADDVKAFLTDSFYALMKGYNEFNTKGKHFLIRTPQQVLMMIAPSHIEEIRKAPITKLSNKGAGNLIFQTSHTLHPELESDQSHFEVVGRKLTPALGTQLMDLVDEAKLVFHEQIGDPKDWKALPMYQASFRMVCQVTNRLLAAESICRDPEFLRWSADYTRSIFGGAAVVRNYPKFLRTSIMKWKTDVTKQKVTARKFYMPIIQQRLADEARYKSQGRSQEWEKVKPKDSVQWLIDLTPEVKRNPEILLYKAMHLNVTGVHAPCVTWVELMYDLCHHPEIHEELRAEMAEVFSTADKGVITRDALSKLTKMDSFIRESARLTPLSAVKLERLAMTDYTLSDGTIIPKGSSIGVIAQGVQLDTTRLPSADQFDPFRFARLREQPGQENNHQFAQTSEINLLFGHGRYACPGRHFASAVEKIMLAFTLMKYDVRFIPGKPATHGQWTQKFRVPDVRASVEWKVRVPDPRFTHMLG